MQKTVNKDNTEVEYQIFGARSKNAYADVASLVLGNYDDDTRSNYRLVELVARDNFGTSESNGYGNFFIRTNGTGSSNPNDLINRVSVLHNGNVGINTVNPRFTLDVAGTIACSNIIIENRQFEIQAPVQNKVYSTGVYEVVSTSFLKNPYNAIFISHLEPILLSDVASSNFNYKVRFYDNTTRTILYESTFSNSQPQSYNVTLSNIMTSNVNIEMHVCKDNIGDHVSINMLTYILK